MSTEHDLADIRKKLRLSRADLAKLARVNVSTISRWETKGIPQRGSARALIDRLAVDAARKKAA